MPKLDGIEALKKIRKIDSDVAVVIFTGYPNLETAVASMKLDAVDYIKKPFNVDEFREVLDRVMRKKGLARTPEESFHKAIGDTIRNLRKEKDSTLKQMSRRTNLSVSLLSRSSAPSRAPPFRRSTNRDGARRAASRTSSASTDRGARRAPRPSARRPRAAPQRRHEGRSFPYPARRAGRSLEPKSFRRRPHPRLDWPSRVHRARDPPAPDVASVDCGLSMTFSRPVPSSPSAHWQTPKERGRRRAARTCATRPTGRTTSSAGTTSRISPRGRRAIRSRRRTKRSAPRG